VVSLCYLSLFLVFLVRVLAELNHRPIDFVEGELELLSGFNVDILEGHL